MNNILISIKPRFVADILNGKKIYEIRKTAPKDKLPIDVYIYCTKEDSLIKLQGRYKDRYICEQEFRCDDFPKMYSGYEGNGKVVAKFTLNKVDEIKLPYTKFGTDEWVGCENERTLQTETLDEKELLEKSCVGAEEIYKYLNFKKSPNNVGYAWHIDNLEIFDEPKELGQFVYRCMKKDCNKCNRYFRDNDYCNQILKAPQDWCYALEVVEQ